MWTVLVAIAMLHSSVFEAWFAWPGIAVGVPLVVGSFAFLAAFEDGTRRDDRARRLHRVVSLPD